MNKRSNTKSGAANQPASSAIILYENPSAREQAVGFCEQLVRQSTGAAPPVIRWVSFEKLTLPKSAEEILHAAVSADLIAFAVTSLGDLPDEIKLWTERWLVRRGEREGSLVGLVLGQSGQLSGAASVKEIYFRHLAHRAGMDYLSHFPGHFSRPIPNSLDSFSQRAVRISPVLDEILNARFVPPSLPLK